ncbi:MAG: zinc ribbon domain-containing protein [Chloroflexi bacterium]|nr:zinc ribbon domain-containing protein [Chloroflexota bacterium]
MPMYEFACRSCGHPFEKRLRMSQSSNVQVCPNCSSEDTRRRISSSFAVGGGSRTAAAPAMRPPSSPFT